MIIDEVSLGLIKGSKIDYTEELIGSQFQVIDNPQAISGCGYVMVIIIILSLLSRRWNNLVTEMIMNVYFFLDVELVLRLNRE